ncbi:MAG TPA: tellurite resistance TerB family protein [Candidatus Thermoplasmatota archaeon]|nr:tellurite resistance TerB family protein [Candidatus Thermoplasmatota archaeon]
MDPLTPAEAFVGIAFCAAYSDGTMGAEEDQELSEQLQSCHALVDLDEADLRAAMMKVDAIARKHGDAALLAHAAAALPPELRETAFCLGAELVVADGEFAREERSFLERLRSALAVEPALAQRIMDVLSIRDRG